MKMRRFLNVAIGQYYDGGSLGRIINPNKHLFFPSTAQAQHHQIQRAAAAKVKAKQRKSTSSASDEDCNGASAPPETDYDVLRVATPKFRFKASTCPGGRTGMLDFFPFYSGTGATERILCVDSNGMAALYDADAATIEVMPRLHEPKRWEPISFFVTHAAHPGALYVMDGAGCSFEALVYGDPDSPWSRMFVRNDRHIWHWRRLPPPPLGAGSSIAIESYALHGHDGGEDASSGSNTTICVSLRDSGSSSNSGGKAVPAGGTYCFDTGTGEWTKAGRWRLPFSSRVLHVPELGNNFLFGIDGNNSDRFCAVDVLGAMRTNGSAPVLQHEWVDVYPLPNWSLHNHSVAYLGDGRFCIHRSFEVMEMDGWGSDYESVDTVVLLTGVEVVREGSKLRMVKHKSKRLDHDSYNVF